MKPFKACLLTLAIGTCFSSFSQKLDIKDAFPEIEDFFQKDYFSESDLNELIISLTSKYYNENLSKAKNILELKLLGYKLKSEEDKSSEIKTNNLNNDLKKSENN